MRSRNGRAGVGAHACHQLDQEPVGDCVSNRSDTDRAIKNLPAKHIMS